MKFFYGVLIVLCLLVPEGFSAEAPPAGRLPQDAPWKITLRDWLSKNQAQDFEIADHEFRMPADYPNANPDRIYRDWIVLGHPGREPVTAGFRAAPEWFTLAKIEGDQVRSFPEPAALAWWVQFSFPGNPYFESPAGKRRALAIAVVDLLMLETSHSDPRNIKPDFMGANLGTWAYTFRVCKDQLSPEARAAFQQGMLHYLDLMERIAPRDGNTNMDMREIATLAELDHIFGEDPKLHRRLVNLARRILFGNPNRGPETSDPRRGTFHPAGYIGEADGPETSYNGISLYHLAEAAMISRGSPDWDAFLPEVVRRMVRFKAYNTFPEPAGGYEGPSSWSTRTNAPYVNDQRDRPWRPIAEAMLTDEAIYRLGIDPQGAQDQAAFGLASPEKMLADIKSTIQRYNRRPRSPEKWKPDSPPIWQEEHWPADLPYTWDHYVPGSYERFRKMLSPLNVLMPNADALSPVLAGRFRARLWQQRALFRPPFGRSEDFNLSFDEEFWMAKQGEWGFQVEAVPHMSRSYDKGGSGALAGGSLAAFWTKSTGCVLLGRLPDKWNYVTWDKITSWSTHHLWGRTAKGPAFSSARQWHPWVHFDLDEHGRPRKVHIMGSLGPDRTVEQEDLLDPGQVFYRRRFELRKEGLYVESELLSRGEDQITELWETLPVFLNPTRRNRNADAGEPVMEFRIGQDWQPGGEQLTEGVKAVRIKRNEGAVVIEFDPPQRVKLGEVITTRYQKKDRLRNLNIDLLGSNGEPKSMPKDVKVGYLIRPERVD